MQQFLRSKMMAGLVFYMLLQTGLKRQFQTLSQAATHVSAETPTLWTSRSWPVTNRFRNPTAPDYFRAAISGLRLVLEKVPATPDRQFVPAADV